MDAVMLHAIGDAGRRGAHKVGAALRNARELGLEPVMNGAEDIPAVRIPFPKKGVGFEGPRVKGHRIVSRNHVGTYGKTQTEPGAEGEKKEKRGRPTLISQMDVPTSGNNDPALNADSIGEGAGASTAAHRAQVLRGGAHEAGNPTKNPNRATRMVVYANNAPKIAPNIHLTRLLLTTASLSGERERVALLPGHHRASSSVQAVTPAMSSRMSEPEAAAFKRGLMASTADAAGRRREARGSLAEPGRELVVEGATRALGHVSDTGDDGRLSLEVNLAPAQTQGQHGVPRVTAAVNEGLHGSGLAHHFQKIGRPQPCAGSRCGHKQKVLVLSHGGAGFDQSFDDAGCQSASSATRPGNGVPSSQRRKAPPAVET